MTDQQDMEMYAAVRRNARRRAEQEGHKFAPCPHKHTRLGYCTNCGEWQDEPKKEDSLLHLYNHDKP